MTRDLRSISYEPTGEASLFDRWEARSDAALLAPLAVRDTVYRSLVVDSLAPYQTAAARLISVGAGNGYAEAALAVAGWHVLATDPSASALRHCQAKRLAVQRYELLTNDPSPGSFEVIYCDGVLGHLWNREDGSMSAWKALARLGSEGSVCLVSNDLSEDDSEPSFAVRSTPDVEFYRPPAGGYAADALATGRWSLERERIYTYERSGLARRRELLIVRLTDARTDESG